MTVVFTFQDITIDREWENGSHFHSPLTLDSLGIPSLISRRNVIPYSSLATSESDSESSFLGILLGLVWYGMVWYVIQWEPGLQSRT
ncbi:hypothetical protein K1719_015506 [Acacia pycnantha]|nr:hypothetical protein K1719_015506 [Acacia pycnantha]